MNRLFFPDYQRTIMNVSNSILKHYHCHAPHPTIPELDQRLNEKTKHVVLLLIDGMGEAILDQYPHETIHLRNDHIQTISSVFSVDDGKRDDFRFDGSSTITDRMAGMDAVFL